MHDRSPNVPPLIFLFLSNFGSGRTENMILSTELEV